MLQVSVVSLFLSSFSLELLKADCSPPPTVTCVRRKSGDMITMKASTNAPSTMTLGFTGSKLKGLRMLLFES